MKHRLFCSLGWILLLTAICLSACQRQNTVCPEKPENSPARPALAELLALPLPDPPQSAVSVEIAGKSMMVDKLVNGPLCNDTWKGIVYVGCDAVVAEWQGDQENPLFLQGCNLNIEPGTVVYVAAHNDAAYYKGCSCHTGDDPLP